MRFKRSVALALASTSLVAFANVARAQDATEPTASGDEGGIVVLGSRIPRVQIEGPAPVTTITAEDIQKNGYQDISDVMRAVTQNTGETQTPQGYSDAEFTPGAQQVDLRGLGPGFTLVLVNGRRIADFPLPLGGNSNFTDITNIPVGLIERVEVLSGSASAVYGSDAIAGVVNFQLKSRPDGTRIDVRGGLTEHGGGESFRITATSGFETGALRALFGVEYSEQRPLWMYERDFQDSSKDEPGDEVTVATRNFLRLDEYEIYIDPGQETCDALAYLNDGTTYYATRPEYGFDLDTYEYVDGHYCGSDEAYGYGTMINQRRAITGYGTFGYELSDSLELFLDAQVSYSNLKQFKDVLEWFYVEPGGDELGAFYNPLFVLPEDTYSGEQVDNWYRKFTPEEMGGFGPGMTRNRSWAYNITPGIKGRIGDSWNYEVSFNHAENRSRIGWREVLIEESNDFFLGPEIDDPDNESGYARYDANPARLYTPLTPEEFLSITAVSTYRPKTWVNNFSATINTTELFDLPAGPVGFAAVAEIGNQGYEINPDPLALTQYYVGILDSDGEGRRKHWGAGGELRVPILPFLTIEGAGRYDRYSYADHEIDKFTYNLGAELRPMDSLLFRAAYGTGFRAPDLHYLFKLSGQKDSGGTDYYRCRLDDPSADYSDCGSPYDGSRFFSRHVGNLDLKPETSTSLNAGFFFQPTRNISFSADYFRVKMKNQVLNLSIDSVLRDEASCRLGEMPNGEMVDPTSPTCIDAIARVERYLDGVNEGEIRRVSINPINIAEETTDGVDVALNVTLPTERLGQFSFSAGYTYVIDHTSRQFPGDPIEDQLSLEDGYYIPRDKATASLSWTLDRFSATLNGQRLGRLPNYDQDRFMDPTYLFNLSAQYSITDNLQLSGTVTNLFDKRPQYDPTWVSYPYYNSSWFDGVGREFFLQLTYKMGGSPL